MNCSKESVRHILILCCIKQSYFKQICLFLHLSLDCSLECLIKLLEHSEPQVSSKGAPYGSRRVGLKYLENLLVNN